MTTSSLLVWRLRLALATFRGKGGRLHVLQLAVSAWVAAMFLLGSSLWFRGIAREEALAPLAPAAVFAALHAAFLLSLVRDMGAAIGHLFLAPDVPLLLSLPLRVRPLLLLRALEAVADAFSFPATLIVPILWGYGVATGAPWPYYVAVPLVMIGLLCLTVALGFLVSLAIAPLVPAGRARGWIRGVSAAIYLLVWMTLAWWNVAGARHVDAIPSTLGRVSWAWSASGPIAWSPSAWAARLLVGLAHGERFLVPLFLLGGSIALAAGLLALAAPRYPVSWQRSQELERKVAERRPRRRAPAAIGKAFVGLASGGRSFATLASGLSLGPAFFQRDRRLIARDTALLWDIALLVFMSSVLPLLAAPALASRVSWIVLPALLFFATELGFDLASRALPLERLALPWVLRAPLSAWALCAARVSGTWMLGAPLVIGLALAATLATGLGGARAAWHAGLALAAFTTLVPIGFATGALFGQAEWRHPRQMLNMGGRMLLAGMLVVLSVGIAIVYAERGPHAGVRTVLAAWGMPAAAGLVLVDILALRLAVGRLRRFEWLN